MRRSVSFLALLFATALAPGAKAQLILPKAQAPAAAPAAKQEPATAPASSPRKLEYELTVPGDKPWFDTGVDIAEGDRLAFTADGKIRYALEKDSGPEGLPRGWRDLLRSLPVNEAGGGALIARIGEGEAIRAFLVGQSREIVAPRGGRLFLGVNQQAAEQSSGSFHVRLRIQPGGATPPAGAVRPAATAAAGAVAPQAAAGLVEKDAAARPGATAAKPVAETPVSPGLASLPAAFLQQVPRRVADQAGNPGDMVNFLILGPAEKMQEAFRSAGWVQVDRSPREAVLHGLLATLSKQAYTQLPMSELYLFGRPQDFGFARADPVSVVTTRHHLRLWKAPFELNGQTVWVGAATHDVGLDRDNRNGGVTHRIDPAVDTERDFVRDSLLDTGLFRGSALASPADPLLEAHTATGGTFHSDGRVLVLTLK